jgi:hypothetical protein
MGRLVAHIRLLPALTRSVPSSEIMKRKGYYSPALRRELVSRLYHKAQQLQVPMTVLNDQIVQEALDRMEASRFPDSLQPIRSALAA